MKNKKIFWFLSASTLSFSWLAWLMVFRSLYWATENYWVWPIVFFFACLVFFNIFVIVENNLRTLYLVAALVALPAVFLAKGSFLWMVPLYLLACLLIREAIQRVEGEKNDRLKIHPENLIRLGLPFLTTALCFLISSGYYFSFLHSSSGKIARFSVAVPAWVIDSSLELSSKFFMPQELGAIAQGITVDEYLDVEIEKNSPSRQELLQGKSVESQLLGREITAEEAAAIQSQLVKQEFVAEEKKLARQRLEQQLDLPIEGQEKIKDLVRDVINKRIGEFFNGKQGQNGQALPISLALALFLTLKSLAWILGYLLRWTTTVIFRIMVKMKILQIEKVLKEVEVIV